MDAETSPDTGMNLGEPESAGAEKTAAADRDHMADSADFLRSVASAVPNGVYVWDAVERRMFWTSSGVFESLGYTPQEFADMGSELIPRLVHPDDAARLNDSVGEMDQAADGTVLEHEYRWLHADGSWRTLRHRTVPFRRDADGTLLQVLGIATDVTEQNRVEQELRESRDFKESLLASLDASVFVVDMTDRVIRECNEPSERIIGYSRDELVGSSVRLLHVDDEHYEEMGRLMGAAIQKGESYHSEFLVRRKNGEVFEADITARRLTPSRPGMDTVGIVRDISERKRTERALEESERRFREMLDNVGLLALMLDAEGRITYCNDFAAQSLGYSKEDLVGCSWFERCIPAASRDEVRVMFEKGIRDGWMPEHHENEIAIHSGEQRLVAWNNTLLRDFSGEVTGAASIGVDVTELRRAEQLKEDFISMISHELRTPLSAISGYAYLIKQSAAGDNQALGAADAIIQRAHHMADLVGELLEISQIQSGDLRLRIEQVDVATVIGHAVSGIVVDGRHPIVTEIPAGLPPLRADAARLGHVLSNLLGNAVKFSPDGGEIKVTASVHGETVRIQVSDQGIGVPHEDRERIFERFVQGDMSSTRGFGGVGMGLFIAKVIVEAHGGTIGVDDGTDVGSTFTVELPLAGPAPAA